MRYYALDFSDLKQKVFEKAEKVIKPLLDAFHIYSLKTRIGKDIQYATCVVV
jgi:hypothetical protein